MEFSLNPSVRQSGGAGHGRVFQVRAPFNQTLGPHTYFKLFYINTLDSSDQSGGGCVRACMCVCVGLSVCVCVCVCVSVCVCSPMYIMCV